MQTRYVLLAIGIVGTSILAKFFTQVRNAQAHDIKPDIASRHHERVKQYCKTKSITHLVEYIAANKATIDIKSFEEIESMTFEIRDGVFNAIKDQSWYPYREWPRITMGNMTSNLSDFASKKSLCYDGLELLPTVRPREPLGLIGQYAVVSHTFASNRTNRDLVLLTNAANSEFGSITRGVVITSGEITCRSYTDSSVLIAAGSIRFPSHPGVNSFSASASSITFDSKKYSSLALNEQKQNVIIENKPPPFGLHFYSTREDGLEVVVEKGIANVKAIAKDSLYAPLGLQVGDILAKVNSGKVDSLTELNRLMCRAMVTNREVMAVIKRGNDTLIGKMTFPEPKK